MYGPVFGIIQDLQYVTFGPSPLRARYFCAENVEEAYNYLERYDLAFNGLKNCEPIQKNMRKLSSNHLYILKQCVRIFYLRGKLETVMLKSCSIL